MNRTFMTVLIFVVFFLLGLLFLMWGVLLPDMVRKLAMSELVSGALFTLFSVGMMLGALFGGKYINRYNYTRLMASLCLADGVVLGLMSLVPNWQLLLFSAFLVGLISASIVAIGHTLIGTMYDAKRFVMMGLMDTFFSLGTFVASFFVNWLFQIETNWRLPVQLVAAVFVVIALIVLISERLLPSKNPVAQAQKGTLQFSKVLAVPAFLLLGLVSFGYGAVEFGTANWFVTYTYTGLQFEEATARILLAWFTAGMVLSRLSFFIVLRWVKVRHLMRAMVSMMFVGAVISSLSTEHVHIAAGNLLLGLGLGGLFPLVLSSAMSIDKQSGPILSGICILGNSFGVQVASFSIGLWASMQSISVAYTVIPIMALWLFVTTFLFARSIPRGN